MRTLEILHLSRLLTAVLLVLLALPAAAQLETDYLDSELWTRHRDCRVKINTLASVSEYGLQLWDVADSAAPALLGQFYTDTWRAYSVDFHGSLAVVATLNGPLYVLDIGDPANIVAYSTIIGVGSSPDVILRNVGGTQLAYSAGNISNGLQVHDISDPTAPVLRGSATISGLESLALIGDTLIALSVSDGLFSVDVSDPDNPAILDQEFPAGSVTNVTAFGDLAVVAAMDAGFHVYDASNPADLVLLGTVPADVNLDFSGLRVMDVMLEGSTLYAVTNFGGPLVYDLSDPLNPALLGYDTRLDESSSAPYVAFRDGDLGGGRLFACHLDTEQGGVMIWDVAGANPEQLGLTEPFDFSRYAAASGDMVFSASGDMGVFGLQRLPDGTLARRGALPLTRAWGVEAHGDLVYVASTDNGLVMTDWADPDNPTIVGSLDMGQARTVTVLGGIAYVGAFSQGFHTVDVSDPANPLPLDSEVLTGMTTYRLDVADSLAATADENGGVNLWNVADPANIQHLANWPTPNKAQDVLIRDGLLYVVVKFNGLQILDISDPTLPDSVGFIPLSTVTGVKEFGDRMLLSAGSSGLQVYSLVDPLNPVLESGYDSPGTTHAAVGADVDEVVLADDSGLLLLSVRDVTAAETSPDYGERTQLAAWPNPFNPRTDIRFELAAPARVELAIFDVNGRRLRQLALGDLDAGPAQFRWDGRDDAGRALASGVYLARLAGRELGSGRILDGRQKLVLVR